MWLRGRHRPRAGRNYHQHHADHRGAVRPHRRSHRHRRESQEDHLQEAEGRQGAHLFTTPRKATARRHARGKPSTRWQSAYIVAQRGNWPTGTAAGAERDASAGEPERLAGERLPVRQGSPEPHHAARGPHDADTAATVDGDAGLPYSQPGSQQHDRADHRREQLERI